MDEKKQNSISILGLNLLIAFSVFYNSKMASKPTGISLFKVNNENTKSMCEICL